MDGVGGVGAGIGADVILEFDKSIRNIQAFGDQMTMLDAKFGSLDQRIDAMKSSLSALSTQTSKATGSNLRKSIEAELNNIVAANGVVLSSIGTAPMKVKQDTVRHLFARVDAELNRAIKQQIGAINVKIDPNFNNGTIPIGKSEFDELNKEIARLVKTQVRNLVDSIKKNGVDMIGTGTLAGMEMDIGKDTVKQILVSIKNQLKPILLNPKLSTEGMSLTLSQKDLNQMMAKIKAKIKDAIDFDFDGVLNKGNEVDSEILKTTRKVDSLVENYVKSIRNGMNNVNPRNVEVPMSDLSKRLRQYIARDLKVTEQQLMKTMGTIDSGSASGYELKRQFSSLERTVNSKMNSGTSKLITDLRRSVREVEFEPNSSMKHYLIHEINKLNNEIVKKVRQQIDQQFTHMRGEVASINSAPRDINRNGKMSNMGGGGYGGNSSTVINNYGARGDATGQGKLDPYARRDNHFNGFGLEGALTNTLRHIVAGSMVGMPLMAAYKAMETFKTSQLEQLKIFQNYMMKDEYQVKDENGKSTPDFAKVEQEVTELMPYVKQTAGFYAVDYGDMSKVAGVASRLTESKDEARAFMDAASMIYRMDNEGDIVNTIAPGIEAIMGQFGLSVWHMDDVVKSFGVATNVTKATTDDLMKALMRSGSTFNAANISADQATMMTASALQSTGLSGEDIGNMFKTFNSRLGMESVNSKLADYGVDVYEEDEYGRKMRRDGMDVYTDLANLVLDNKVGDQTLDEILQASAGGYQIGKVRAFIDSMNDKGYENEQGLNVHDMIEKAKEYQMEDIYAMMAKSMNSNIMNMERAKVEFDVALTSVIESLAPAISELSKVMVNLSQGIGENSDTIAQLIGVIGNTILGAAMWYGGKKLMNGNGFQGHYENAKTHSTLWGGKGLSGRDQVGNVVGSHNLMDDKNLLRSNTAESRAFVNAAATNSVLAPYIREMTNMDSKRQEQMNRYMTDTRGKGSTTLDLADFFKVMDESRGYDGRGKMSATDMHSRSAYNAQKLTSNPAMANVFTPAFSTSLNGMMSDRSQFLGFNAQSGNRSFTKEFARMNDGTRGDFANHLERNFASTGKTITNMAELQTAFADFGKEQQRTRIETARTSPALTDMRGVINDMQRDMDRAARSGNRFGDFIDDIGRRGRATLPTLLSMGKAIGGFAAQMAIMYAVGDVISASATNAGLNTEQRKLRDKQTQIDSVGQFGEMQKMKADGDWLGIVGKSFQLGFINSVRDMFSPGNQHVSLNDELKRDAAMTKWSKETYGTANVDKVLKQENAKLGKDDEPFTIDDYLSKYKKDSGLYKEFGDMEYENFKKEYDDMTVAQGKKDDMRRAFDEQKSAFDLEKWMNGDDISMPIADTIATMKEQLNSLRLDNAWENVNALLSGVKSNSVEYLEIRKKQLQEEIALYDKQMEQSDKNIAMYKSQLEALESTGKMEEWDEEKQKNVKTKEYTDTERNLNKEELRKKEVEKELGESQANAKLEERKIEFQINKKPIDERVADAGYNRQMSDLYTSLGTVENSRAFYDEKLHNAQSELANMQSALADYQAIDPELDVDGELKGIIENLEKSILDQTIELKNLRLSKVLSYKDDLDVFRDDQDIASLRQRLALGGVDENDPAMKHFRINQLNKERGQLETHIANLKAAASDPNATPDEVSKIQAEIRELTKQSLQTQLGIYQELKNTGATFNLPDGVQVMTQYDYMASKGTHSNMTVQAGNTYVNITLPNLTGSSGSKAFADAGLQIGQGIAQGRQNSYRNQYNGAPWNYPSF